MGQKSALFYFLFFLNFVKLFNTEINKLGTKYNKRHQNHLTYLQIYLWNAAYSHVFIINVTISFNVFTIIRNKYMHIIVRKSISRQCNGKTLCFSYSFSFAFWSRWGRSRIGCHEVRRLAADGQSCNHMGWNVVLFSAKMQLLKQGRPREWERSLTFTYKLSSFFFINPPCSAGRPSNVFWKFGRR